MSYSAALAPVQISANRLDGFGTDLLVQVPCTEIDPTRSLVHRLGVGVVYTIGFRQRKVRIPVAGYAIEHTLRANPDADILVDAGLYSGSQRICASGALSSDWVRFQHQRGLGWALTDSGYCAAKDYNGVKALLGAAQKLGPRVIVALPIAGEWLSSESAFLREQIDAAGVPVGLIVEDVADPFDQPYMVAGLVDVLRSKTPVLLLRSDTAALGALAYGAAGAALGSSSAYRHLYPNLGGGGTAPVSFVVPGLLSYVSTPVFDAAHQLAPELDAWKCDCSLCQGSDLAWINGERGVAFEHSISAAATLGEQLIPTTNTSSIQQWTSMCRTAQAKHHEVMEATGIWKGLKPSLQQWINVEPVRALV